MVLKGQAGPGLLGTYESERKPLCELIVEQAYTRYIKRVDSSLPTSNLAPLLDDVAIELGSTYTSDALLEDPHRPSGRPGTRVPHIMLRRRRDSVSTLDLADHGFALLAGEEGRGWTEAARALAATGIPLTAYRIGPGADLEDPEECFAATVGIRAGGALLLRPDGVIAWRAPGPRSEARGELDTVIRRVLFLD